MKSSRSFEPASHSLREMVFYDLPISDLEIDKIPVNQFVKDEIGQLALICGGNITTAAIATLLSTHWASAPTGIRDALFSSYSPDFLGLQQRADRASNAPDVYVVLYYTGGSQVYLLFPLSRVIQIGTITREQEPVELLDQLALLRDLRLGPTADSNVFCFETSPSRIHFDNFGVILTIEGDGSIIGLDELQRVRKYDPAGGSKVMGDIRDFLKELERFLRFPGKFLYE